MYNNIGKLNAVSSFMFSIIYNSNSNMIVEIVPT